MISVLFRSDSLWLEWPVSVRLPVRNGNSRNTEITDRHRNNTDKTKSVVYLIPCGFGPLRDLRVPAVALSFLGVAVRGFVIGGGYGKLKSSTVRIGDHTRDRRHHSQVAGEVVRNGNSRNTETTDRHRNNTDKPKSVVYLIPCGFGPLRDLRVPAVALSFLGVAVRGFRSVSLCDSASGIGHRASGNPDIARAITRTHLQPRLSNTRHRSPQPAPTSGSSSQTR